MMLLPKAKHRRAARENARIRTQVQDRYRALRAALNAGQGAAAMIDLVHCFVIDGDVMQCHCCDRRIHVSRWQEPLRHGVDDTGMDCPLLGTDNPWALWFQATDLVRGRADSVATMRRALEADTAQICEAAPQEGA